MPRLAATHVRRPCDGGGRQRALDEQFHALYQPLSSLRCLLEVSLLQRDGTDKYWKDLRTAPALLNRMAEPWDVIHGQLEREEWARLLGDVRQALNALRNSVARLCRSKAKAGDRRQRLEDAWAQCERLVGAISSLRQRLQADEQNFPISNHAVRAGKNLPKLEILNP